MGNKIEKHSSNTNLNKIITNILNEHKGELNKNKIPLALDNEDAKLKYKMIKSNLKESLNDQNFHIDILKLSEEIIKREFINKSFNTGIYNSSLVFPNFTNENEENLSVKNQIGLLGDILQMKKHKMKNFFIDDNDEAKESNQMGIIDSSQHWDKSDKFLIESSKSLSITGVNPISTNSSIRYNKNKLFDDISLQDYLNLEADRLKKELDCNHNHKERSVEILGNFPPDTSRSINHPCYSSNKEQIDLSNVPSSVNLIKNKNIQNQKLDRAIKTIPIKKQNTNTNIVDNCEYLRRNSTGIKNKQLTIQKQNTRVLSPQNDRNGLLTVRRILNTPKLDLSYSTSRKNTSSNVSTISKAPIASVKIDLRDLLKGDMYTKKKSDVQEYLSKFSSTNRSYTDIVNTSNQNGSTHPVTIDDLIIEKQRVELNGRKKDVI